MSTIVGKSKCRIIFDLSKQEIPTMCHEDIIKFLKKNKELLNISGIAGQIGMDRSSLNKALSGKPINEYGTRRRIPERCIPACRKVIAKLQFKSI